MKILILGGAGYIGSHMVYSLCEKGHEVVVADNLLTGHKEALHPKAVFYQGDIREKAFLSQMLEKETGIQGIIHFAASSLVGESMEKPLKYFDNNIGGMISLLEAMVEYKIPNIVFSSTAAVYGEPERIPILETDRTAPTNPYGESKLTMEKMIAWVSRANGIRYVSLRYFNACGAWPDGRIGEAHQPESHLIPLILQVPLGQREKISIYGTDYPTKDGTCVRDYVHVLDLCTAHEAALEYLNGGGESRAFNLGNGVGYTVREIIQVAEKVTGEKIQVEEVKRRAGDPAKLVAKAEQAKELLHWNPTHSALEEIMETAWRWHQSHPKGYSKE